MPRQTLGTRASGFFSHIATLGGVRGGANLAAWSVAGVAAYYLWIRPERLAKEEREARALLSREEDLIRYRVKSKPIPDSQLTGLVKGKGE